MQQTHVWNAADFPAADQDAASYYRQQGLVVSNRDELQRQISKLVKALPEPVNEPQLLELLFTDRNPPRFSEVEEMLKAALTAGGYSGGISYRGRVDKNIVLLEAVPD